MEVVFNKKVENPFYGLQNCLSLFQNGGKNSISTGLLDACWNEVKDSVEKKQMFFALLFSIGDITAREHNIFKTASLGKVDSGGNAQRESFLLILDWLRSKHYAQYKKFLFNNLFDEYVSFDSLFANRIITPKGKKSKGVSKVYASLTGTPEYLNDLAEYCVSIIKGNNPTRKYFLAKFLTRPRTSKRSGHKKMLPETKTSMQAKVFFMEILSDKMSFEVVRTHGFVVFKGYNEWRKEYIGELESVLFSSKKILEFDQQEFLAWVSQLPASARHRVRCRVLTSEGKLKGKWPNLGEWFLQWENFKETKQTEVRVLEEKIRQEGGMSVNSVRTDDEVKLQSLKKEAKVTTGAVNFSEMFSQIVLGTVDAIKVQPFLDKINLPYNTLVFIDDSGSMMGTGARSSYGFTAFDFAHFIATICLMKNPDDEGRSLIGYYSKHSRLFSTMDSRSELVNSILRSTPKPMVSEALIKPEEHFLVNLRRLREFGNSIKTPNYTNISAIPDGIHSWTQGKAELIEQIQKFPVWTIITDGNWNNLDSPEASMNDFMMKCQNYFGFKPFVVAIDVSSSTMSAKASRFSGIENFMFIPPNPAQVEMLLTNFKDVEIMDVYTPLNSLYKSNRYALVKNSVV